MDTNMGRRLRAFGAAVLLIAAGEAKAEETVPPLRSNAELVQYYRMLPLLSSAPTPPHSSLGTNRSFKAIAFDFDVTPPFPVSVGGLSDYADGAMQVRLMELGVDDQIRVLPSAWATTDRPPDGLTHCDILHVLFQVTSAKMTPDGEMDAAAISLFAWQDAGAAVDCLAGQRPVWAMHSAPRLVLARHGDAAALDAQTRHHILALIDWELVEEVWRANAVADAAFRRMLKAP